MSNSTIAYILILLALVCEGQLLPTSITVGSQAIGICIADFNKDGKLDTAVLHGGILTVSLGNGLGNNNNPASLPGYLSRNDINGVGVSAKECITGDFNNDNNIDVAFILPATNTISIWIGNGLGVFTSGLAVVTGTTPQGLTTGLFNADSLPDIAVTNLGGTVFVMINTATGGVGTSPPATLPSFTNTASYPVPNNAQWIITGDFNNDGKVDLATANSVGSSSVSVLLGTGSGTFGAAITTVRTDVVFRLVGGDFNGDGKLDLVVLYSSVNKFGFLAGLGNGMFSTADITFPTGAGPSTVVSSDFNFDNNLDVALTTSTGNTLTVYNGNGLGSFTLNVSYTIAGSQGSVVGDYNNDLKPDVIATSFTSGTFVVFINNFTRAGTAAVLFASWMINLCLFGIMTIMFTIL